MAMMHHGSLSTAALHGCSPPPYTSVTGDLNLLQKIWSKSVVHGPDLFKDSLNSLTAIDGHDRQYFNKLRSTAVSCRTFIRSQSLIAC